MKKVFILLILVFVTMSCIFAETKVSGDIDVSYKFDFKHEYDEETGETIYMKHGHLLSGSIANIEIDFSDISLYKKGDAKFHMDIAIAASLEYDMAGNDLSWKSYEFKIPATGLSGAVKFEKLDIVGEIGEHKLVIDLIHNRVGGDWAKDSHNKYYYTTERLWDPETGELNKYAWDLGDEDYMSYDNNFAAEVGDMIGVSVRWDDWQFAGSASGILYESGYFGQFSFGAITPKFLFDGENGNAQFAGVLILRPVNESMMVSPGGSVRAEYKTEGFSIEAASDFRFDFLRIHETHETKLDEHGLDAMLKTELGIFGMDLFYATKTPILVYRIHEINYPLVVIENYASAEVRFDFHKLPSDGFPMVAKAVLRDPFYTFDDPKREEPYEIAINGQDHDPRWEYDFYGCDYLMHARYGRDLDIDVSYDGFDDSVLREIRVFGHRILQKTEIGAGATFKFGKFTVSDDLMYMLDLKMFKDMLSVEYETDSFKVYGSSLMFLDLEFNQFLFGLFSGIESDVLVEFATIGADFRWNLLFHEDEYLEDCRDFSIFCKVTF